MNIGILIPIAVLGGLGLFFAIGLAYASKKFAVKADPRMEKVLDALAGANCGACGYPGCRGYAEAIITEETEINLCSPGGKNTLKVVAQIMGIEITEMVSKVAVVQCRGGEEEARYKFTYNGIADCKAAQLVGAGFKACIHGCLGMGTCAASCPFGAITMGKNRLPIVNEKKCTGCGICVNACPRGIMALIPASQEVFLACMNKDRGRRVKELCTVGCIACRLCVRKNPKGEEGITMGENLPIINYENLPNWDEANDVCPQDCFIIREPTS